MKFGAFRYALVLVMLSMMGFTSPAAGDERTMEKRAAEAYKRAYQMLLDKQYQKARGEFEKMLSEYRGSRVYDDASYWYCYALEKSTDDREKAFECYREFLRRYEDSKWREEALENALRLARKLAKTDPEVEAWLRKQGEHDRHHDLTPDIIMVLVESAVEEGDEGAVLHLLESSDADTRRWTLYALDDVESPLVTTKLLEIVKKDPDTDVRRHALYVLAGRDDDEKVIEVMVEVLGSENDPDIRRHALYAISESDAPAVVDVLIEIALTEKDPDMARHATYALAEADDPRVTKALERLVKESTDREVKRAALYALVEREDVSILPTLKAIALSGAEDAELARAAVYAIAEMDDSPEAAQTLVEVFKTAEDSELRKAALYGIANHDDAEISVSLLRDAAITTDDEELAKVATYALVEVMQDEDAELIFEVYDKTPFPEVRRAALYAIVDVGGPQALPIFKKVLKTESDRDLRLAAVWAMEKADDEDEAVTILADVARNDPSSKVRRAAIRMLGEIDTEKAKRALIEILKERSKKE